MSIDFVPSVLADIVVGPHGALTLLLLMAAVIDVRYLRIPNWLTGAGLLLGLVWSAAAAPAAAAGLWAALAGAALGLALLLPFYALRVMGAGDVKLMAMVGSFVGLPGIFYAALFTFIAGGIGAVVYALYHRAFRRMTGNVMELAQAAAFAAAAGYRPPLDIQRTSIGRLPYGVSIAAGTIGWLLCSHLGWP